MLDHVSIPVANLERAAAFYDAALGALGLYRRKQVVHGIGYGGMMSMAPCFWLLQSTNSNMARPGVGLHISFCAATRAVVDAFYARALQAGGSDAGPPGMRPEYTQPFYGAFVRDLDGFKIEAVCRAP